MLLLIFILFTLTWYKVLVCTFTYPVRTNFLFSINHFILAEQERVYEIKFFEFILFACAVKIYKNISDGKKLVDLSTMSERKIKSSKGARFCFS